MDSLVEEPESNPLTVATASLPDILLIHVVFSFLA